jgi:hypothetical protein
MVAYTRFILAFLIFHGPTEAFPYANKAKRSIILATATNEGKIHQAVGISEEERKSLIEQRNLRFAGIGR